ncbi:MAG TPA: 2-oxoglutarate dehydrogenase E1 component [Gammaproteobacteria bacterium]|nr:2-oxoglutarate dehydrogenase E1 component [Gammaproteobacteria bacterium]
MDELRKTALLDAGSSAYLEQLYDDYLKNPASVPTGWQQYFEKLPLVDGVVSEASHREIQAAFRRIVRHPCVIKQISTTTVADEGAAEIARLENALSRERKQTAVRALIDGYRLLGHLHADIDPLKLRKKAQVPELMLSYYHLTPADLALTFDAGSLPGLSIRTLQQILDDLKRCYCGTIASEFMHIPDSPERIWVQQQVEAIGLQNRLSLDIQQRILAYLIAADGLEKYLGAKYPGAKRFSLEGTDSLLVALDTFIQQGGVKGAKEIIICMAHRGRLNVLVNLLGKMPNQLFDEFEGKHNDIKLETGDVKYHQGFSSDVSTPGGNVHLSLAFNPSHLEIVTPVVCGSVKARQERRKDNDYTEVLSIALHGDSAFSGQGVVMETLNMSQTRGFKIGGTVHVIVNNQIGFTTSEPSDIRSTLYCSDIGKMMEVPIFHVNADDPEAVYTVMTLALGYRDKFKKDVIIDLIGYRRQGHNEADEPAVTQPVMYELIRKMPTARQLYADKLIAEKMLSITDIDNMIKAYRDTLDSRQQTVARNLVNEVKRDFSSNWDLFVSKDWRIPANTGVALTTLKKLAENQTTIPEGFILHPRVQKIIEDRRKMTAGELSLDWGYAETLAYATLLNEGYLVRLSGQDVGRGTFFHRHVVLHNQRDNAEYTPLSHLSQNQAKFTVIDSLLSEDAVLAFEYGFAKTEPHGLTIWEAQFGDFANNAQVVIDQFISSGEQKWGRFCGLTLYLPHGYEGQGAEHSSARLERYLQLCAEHNIQVCVPTTPAQVFHMIRRQMVRPIRKPLIVLTPKSLLRHKLAVSRLEELEKGEFFPVLSEVDDIQPEQVKRVVLCSGKVYYDLLQKRRADNQKEIAILRVEQLYPFPEIELKAQLDLYAAALVVVWCQEEPKNQGAWYNIHHHLVAVITQEQQLKYVGRQAAAAPAVGYLHLHQEQQATLVNDALNKGTTI